MAKLYLFVVITSLALSALFFIFVFPHIDPRNMIWRPAGEGCIRSYDNSKIQSVGEFCTDVQKRVQEKLTKLNISDKEQKYLDGWKEFFIKENDITEDFFNAHIIITDIVEGAERYIRHSNIDVERCDYSTRFEKKCEQYKTYSIQYYYKFNDNYVINSVNPDRVRTYVIVKKEIDEEIAAGKVEFKDLLKNKVLSTDWRRLDKYFINHLINGHIYDWGAIQTENDLRGLTVDNKFYGCKDIDDIVKKCDTNLKYQYQVENGNVFVIGFSHPKAYHLGNCYRFSTDLIVDRKNPTKCESVDCPCMEYYK